MEEKLYLNVSRLQGELLAIYKEECDGWIDEWNREFLMYEFSDESLEELAVEKAHEFNEDMRKYLNMSSHKIDGNFNNIDYDYPAHVNGEIKYDRPLVDAMIARLNAGEQSKQADADRDWLVDWFWETFGSWGIRYNFSDCIADRLYEFEHEEDEI